MIGGVDGMLKREAKKIFSSLYTDYDRTVGTFTLLQDFRWKSSMLKEADPCRCSRVLDIGVGTGLLEEMMDCKSDLQVVGVDISLEMVKIAKRKKIACLDDVVLADAEYLPFSDERFDLVLSCYVVKYCKLQAFLKQSWLVLRNGGRFLFYDFSKPSGMKMMIHAFYIYFLLKGLGYLLAPVSKGTAYTLRTLPRVIAGSDWEEDVTKEMKAQGYSDISSRFLSLHGARLVAGKKPHITKDLALRIIDS